MFTLKQKTSIEREELAQIPKGEVGILSLTLASMKCNPAM